MQLVTEDPAPKRQKENKNTVETDSGSETESDKAYMPI